MQTANIYAIAPKSAIPFWGNKHISTSVPKDFTKPDNIPLKSRALNLLTQLSVPTYSLIKKKKDLIEDILKLFSSLQCDVFFERIQLRIFELLDINELEEENIIPSQRSFVALFYFLIKQRDFCKKYDLSVFISSEGYASLQYMNTAKNHFFNIKFLNFSMLSYIIINRNTPLFKMEREASIECFFKNLEESKIWLK